MATRTPPAPAPVDLHAQPDGLFHWTDKDERYYLSQIDSHRYPYGQNDAPHDRLARAKADDAQATHRNFAGLLRWWSRGQITLVREYLPEARDLLYLATRLNHPAQLDVFMSAPAEELVQQAWLEAFERWPLLTLRHALAWQFGDKEEIDYFVGGRDLRADRTAREALIDTRIAQALARHPDHIAALRQALVDAPAADAELQRFDRIAAGLRSPTDADIAPPEHWPELLRQPPWRWAKKPSAAEKAAQPWLKVPAKLPTPPLFVLPAQLPAPRLLDDAQAIPAQAVGELLVMLMLGKPGAPWSGLAQVLPAFTPASLADMGRALLQAWESAGAPSDHKWMLLAQATLGDEATLDDVVKRTATWPSAGKFFLAKFGLATLGDMGARPDAVGENALRALIRFAEKGKPSLRAPARAQAQAAAQRLGLSPDELADRLVPDLGLTTPEAFRFDLGARQHTLHFDEALTPFVRDATGARLKDLPKPRADETDTATAATVARWKALKKAAKALASEQIRRLEQALMTARVWQRTDFERLFTQHPLLRELGRRLLWTTVPAAGEAPLRFRLSEEFTPVDVADQPLALPADARLTLAHPIELDEDERRAWSQVFADYELAAPFAQLGREVLHLRADPAGRAADLAAQCLAPGRTIATGALLGLLQQGWQREGDGAHVFGLNWQPAPGARVALGLEDGFDMGSPLDTPQQTLREVRLDGDFSPRLMSEVLRTLAALARQ